MAYQTIFLSQPSFVSVTIVSENPFFEALKASVGRTTTAFDRADNDLQMAISQANEAVGKFTKGLLALGLDQREDGVPGRLYDLDLTEMSSHVTTVGSFFVTHTGYPIQFGEVDRSGAFYSHGNLNTSEELIKHLFDLISSPDSSLTVAIAFRMRRPPAG